MNERQKANQLLREAKLRGLYSDKVIANIADVVSPFISPEAASEFPERIRDWAFTYQFFRDLQADQHLLSKTLKELTTLSRQAGKLEKTIDGLSDSAVRLLTDNARKWTASSPEMVSPASDMSGLRIQLIQTQLLCGMLNALATASDDTVALKRGPKSDWARTLAVHTLGGIYSLSTGKKPTRVLDLYSKPNSRFHKFCVAALTPIHGDKAESGLDKVIREYREYMAKL